MKNKKLSTKPNTKKSKNFQNKKQKVSKSIAKKQFVSKHALKDSTYNITDNVTTNVEIMNNNNLKAADSPFLNNIPNKIIKAKALTAQKPKNNFVGLFEENYEESNKTLDDNIPLNNEHESHDAESEKDKYYINNMFSKTMEVDLPISYDEEDSYYNMFSNNEENNISMLDIEEPDDIFSPTSNKEYFSDFEDKENHETYFANKYKKSYEDENKPNLSLYSESKDRMIPIKPIIESIETITEPIESIIEPIEPIANVKNNNKNEKFQDYIQEFKKDNLDKKLDSQDFKTTFLKKDEVNYVSEELSTDKNSELNKPDSENIQVINEIYNTSNVNVPIFKDTMHKNINIDSLDINDNIKIIKEKEIDEGYRTSEIFPYGFLRGTLFTILFIIITLALFTAPFVIAYIGLSLLFIVSSLLIASSAFVYLERYNDGIRTLIHKIYPEIHEVFTNYSFIIGFISIIIIFILFKVIYTIHSNYFSWCFGFLHKQYVGELKNNEN